MTMLPAYFPSPPQGVWHLGPLPIRAYALFIITGIVVALIIGDRRWEARGGQRGVIYDVALWAVPFGLIGGRLYHLATDWRTYWGPGGAGLGAAVRIWDGGLGIWGAVALGIVGAWISCRRHGIPLPAFADAVAPGIILAQAIGRLGNYFNQELYGRETTQPWGLEIFYRKDSSGLNDPHLLDGVSTGQLFAVVQPTFLYELIWNVLVFVVLIYIDRRFAIGHGRLFASYVALYCVGRFWVELLRDDSATHIAGIRINSFTSTFVFIGAVVYIMVAPKGREDPESLRGNDDVADEESEPEHEPAEELATVVAAAAAAGAAAPVIVEEAEKSADSGETVESAAVVEPEPAAAEAVESQAGEPEAPKVEEPEEAKAEEPEEPEVEQSEAAAVQAETDEPEEPKAEEPEEEEGSGEPTAGIVETEAEDAEAEEEGSGEPTTEVVETEAEDAEAEEPEIESAEAEVAEAEPVAAETEEPETEEAKESAEPEAAEPDAGEPDAAETEPEEPEAEVVETEAEDAEAEGPEAEVAEAEPVELATEEPEEAKAAETEAVEEPESAEDDAEEAEVPQAPEAESETAAVEQDAAESADEAAEEPPAAQQAVEESPVSDDDKGSRRRWLLRRRNRRSSP
jgi:prolipoprotein diacylglyceryl transferase